MMVDFFDTLGTATAIADEAGLIDASGRIPGLKRLLIVDSLSRVDRRVTRREQRDELRRLGSRRGRGRANRVALGWWSGCSSPCASSRRRWSASSRTGHRPALILVGFYMTASSPASTSSGWKRHPGVHHAADDPADVVDLTHWHRLRVHHVMS